MSNFFNMNQRCRVGLLADRAQFFLRFRACERASAAVEMAMLAFPFVVLLVCIFQFYALHLMQSTLSDALYASASNPESVLLAGDKAAYTKILCNKTAFPETCNLKLKLELQPLQNISKTKTAITGTTFNAGSSNDVLLLRASTDSLQFISVVPSLPAKAAVIFRRPI